jgi:hypothetical protein
MQTFVEMRVEIEDFQILTTRIKKCQLFTVRRVMKSF